jgi:predicted metal-dependent HD superfamily phosphohydrolase
VAAASAKSKMTMAPQLRVRLWNELLPRYSEPHRHYHNARHIYDCFRELEAVKLLARDPLAIDLAILFHDAVYDPRRSDNEDQSALLAARALADFFSRETIASVKMLIDATRHHSIPTNLDAQLLVDIDLSILGQSADRFDEYEQQIRQEYLFVPENLFREKRAGILERFLARPSIFQTDFFRERYEASARMNLARSVARLRHGS